MDTPCLLNTYCEKENKSKNNKIMFLIYLSAVILPSLIRSYIFRNSEIKEKESIMKLYLAFLYGFTIAAYLSLIMNTYFSFKIKKFLLSNGYIFNDAIKISNTVTSVVVAPIIEEYFKGIGLFLPFIYEELNEKEDGIIFGAEIGNGFSTIENIFYGNRMKNRIESTILILIRQFTSSALHTYATAIIGEGVSLYKMEIYNKRQLTREFIKGMIVHAIHNYSCIFLPSQSMYLQILSYGKILSKLRRKIKCYDLE